MEYNDNCCCGNYHVDLEPNQCLCIKVGSYQGYNNALDLQVRLLCEGYAASILRTENMYWVQIGDYYCLEEAARMEICLREKGYNTMMIFYQSHY